MLGPLACLGTLQGFGDSGVELDQNGLGTPVGTGTPFQKAASLPANPNVFDSAGDSWAVSLILNLIVKSDFRRYGLSDPRESL